MEIQEAIKNARAAQRERILNSFNVDAEEDVSKGQQTNPFDEYEEEFDKAEENDVEKSDVMQAISGCDSDIKVSKTGKELKAQADILLSELNSKLAIKQSEADMALKDCGGAPTRNPDKWYTDGICTDCGYKIYDWNETYFPENQSQIMPSLSAEDLSSRKGNIPENREQAECRRAYNDIVYAICQIMVDIKACEILKGLDDGKEYTLTPRQIFALGF